MDKQSARILIRKKLRTLDNKQNLSTTICKKIKGLNMKGKSILLYKALPSEVNVDELISTYLKTFDVYLPKVKGEEMVVIKIDENTKYSNGAFNIKEPIGKELNPEEVDIDICITPLLGFDESLNRLGKGKGYYDRFFAKCNCRKIGVAFETQKVDSIDADKFDVKLDMIVTEGNVYANN